MNYDNPYAYDGSVKVAQSADRAERTAFIQRTYIHLAGAIAAFLLIEFALLTIFPAETLWAFIGPAMGGWGWLVVLAAFMGVSWLARSWADSGSSRTMQYAGLGLYVVAEAAIFLPIMALSLMIDPQGGIPMQAGLITAVVFGGLTLMVFATGADFSWLGRYLWLAGLVGLGVIVVGAISGFTFGLWVSAAFVLLAAGYILYDTSNVMHHYRTDQHVAASLALFASVALLLWYVMRILISMSSSND